MKLKSLLTFCLVAIVFVFTSCKDDESAPKLEFLAEDGTSISLADANLYLMDSWSHTYDFDEFDARDYLISDGTYVEGSIWNIDNYEGATFLLQIGLMVPADQDFNAGNFPLRWDYATAPAGKNFSYLYMKFADNSDYYESYDNESNASVVVSGGVNNGEKMTLSYKGTLKYYHSYDSEAGWQNTAYNGTFYFSGTVQDKRAL